MFDRTDTFFGVFGRTLNCRVRVHLIHRFKKGDRSYIRCYVCNIFCTGVAVPIIRHSVSLHIYPQVLAPRARGCASELIGDHRWGFILKISPRKGWITVDLKIVELCSCSLDANALVVETVWVIVCLLYTSPSPRDGLLSRMPSSA